MDYFFKMTKIREIKTFQVIGKLCCCCLLLHIKKSEADQRKAWQKQACIGYANKRQACGGSRGTIEKQLNFLKIINVQKESVQKNSFFRVCVGGEYSFCNLPFPRSLHLWKSLPLWEKKAKKKVRLGITWNVLISLDFSVLKKRGNKLRKVSY